MRDQGQVVAIADGVEADEIGEEFADTVGLELGIVTFLSGMEAEVLA